jgi:hypothetical protein
MVSTHVMVSAHVILSTHVILSAAKDPCLADREILHSVQDDNARSRWQREHE